MLKRRHVTVPALLAFVLIAGSTGAVRAAQPARHVANHGSITVFAAASLKAAFTTLGTTFSQANDVTVRFNFGGSDTLAQQIVQGAPADVFASANQAQMTVVQGKNLIAGTPTVFTRNRLVVVVPTSNPKHIYNLPDLGNPDVNLVLAAPSVPVGKYARQAFQVMASDSAFGPDFLKRIQQNTKSNETDVSAVLAKVTLGEADAGVVYVTDAATVPGKVQTIDIPDPFNQIAVYPIAVTKNAGNSTLAQKFVSYVLSSTGKQVLAKLGFITSLPVATYAPSLSVTGLVSTPLTLTASDLQKLPNTTDTVTLRTDTGKTTISSYTGPLLYTVLQQAGLVLNTASFKNDALRQFVTIVGSDNYQVTVSLAEILPTFGNQRIILAWAKGGKPLGQDEGAVRLIVPNDTLAGRYVTNVTQVVVGTPAGTP